MAKTTTLQLNSQDSNGKTLSKMIPYANPSATDTALGNFAKACNALTTNTYVDTVRIDKTSLNESTAD